jgi:flagellin-like protein
MIKSNKRGISPIITTILLVVIAMILAVIILVWARGFMTEKISKFIPSQSEARPITEACDAVLLEPAVTGTNSISIINRGDIPLHMLGVRVTDATSGDSTIVEYVQDLKPGQSNEITTDASQILLGNKVEIVPILLGQSEKEGIKQYNCKNWIEVV